MPTDRFQYGVRWAGNRRQQAGGEQPESYIRLWGTTALRQTRVPEQGLLKDAPAAFTLWNLEAGHTFLLGKNKTRTLEIGLTVQNIANARYREYLNFFRFFADEPGGNVGIRFKLSL